MIIVLDDRAVIRIAGADAATLLQNVVTLDVPGVDHHGSGYGALLTPQGKILFDFILHRLNGDYAVDVRADQAEAFAKRLSLYKLRAKVEILPAPELGVFVEWAGRPAPSASPQGGGGSPPPSGSSGQGAEKAPRDPRLAELGTRWVASRDSIQAIATASDWHRHRIALAIPEGNLDFPFGDAFPHDAAMDSLNGIAFEKGCYIGQEVVSRMRHRGTARRRVVAISATQTLPEVGAEIVAAGRPLGRLGTSADGKGIAIMRLDRTRAALDSGEAILAGGQKVDVALPKWATYGWPAPAQSAED